MELFDSHCHLDPEVWGDDLAGVIARARDAGVRYMVTIGGGDSVAYAQAAVDVADSDPEIYATVGIHPHDAVGCDDACFAAVAELARRPDVVGVGETGLDYHYDHSPREVQQALFRRFIQLAHEVDKALVIHVRSAFDDCLRILDEEGGRDLDVVMHCFTGTLAEAERSLELGCHLSIPGIVTFKKAGDIEEAARITPLDRLMIETDSPYLAPVPKRGRKNEPAYLVHTLAKVAEAREMSVEALADATTRNALTFYGLT